MTDIDDEEPDIDHEDIAALVESVETTFPPIRGKVHRVYIEYRDDKQDDEAIIIEVERVRPTSH